MKKESTLSEKIKAYGAMATAILAMPKASDAQNIVYTDVNPDTVITNGVYPLDLNNDGTPDFQLSQSHNTSGDLAIVNNYGSNSVDNKYDTLVVGPYTIPFPSPDTLHLGAPINANNNWVHLSSGGSSTSSSSSSNISYFVLGGQNANYGIHAGNWFDKGEFYMGLRFYSGGNTYYGWARLELGEGAGTIILKDYAYNAEPDSGLFAGQIFPDGVKNISAESSIGLFNFYSEDNKLHIRLLNEKLIGGKEEVFNASGQVVFSGEVTSAEFPLDLSQLSSGIYFVRVSNSELKQTKKIVINRR